MKNLLVPTDFSPEAHSAFEVALHLARRTGGSVTLLHVLELPETAHFSSSGSQLGGSDMDDVYVLKLLQLIKHRMHDLMREAERTTPGVPVHEALKTARVAPSILEVIAEQHSDLVVMGAQGHTAWEHFFAGSTTERLVRMAPCPVLTVKHEAPKFDVRRMVFPSTFSAEADRAVAGLRDMQAVFPEATLLLLTVVSGADQQAAALERIQTFIERHQLPHAEAVVFEAPNASNGIPRFAQENQIDLIVMPTHGRTGLSHYLQASIAEHVATHAFPPVLTFKLA